MSTRLFSITLVLVVSTAGSTFAQSQESTPPPAKRPARPAPPARDPNTPGYVAAKELPDGEVPPADADGNFVIGPTHKRAPAMEQHEGVPQGTIHNLTMNSADSKSYPGIAREPGTFGTVDPDDPAKLVVTTSHPAPYTRRVAVYVPKQYVPGTAAPFIVGADGPDRGLFAALDNLIAEKKVPVMIGISISNGSGDAQGSQRGLEYDTMSGKYAEFVESEVLPLVEKECNVKLTKDPEGRATMGGSSGGSCALEMAWYHPELYHRVLTYSGTYVNQQWPPNAETPHGAWEFHEHLIPNSPAKPIRLWMEVGDRDLLNPNVMRDEMHDWVLANEKMAKVLTDKGYHYQFVFAKNAGHTDRNVKEQTLPEALEYLWQGYKVEGAKNPPASGAADQVMFAPYNKTGIYEPGEKIGWMVSVADGEKAPSGSFKYKVKKNNFEPVDSGVFDLSAGTAKIEVSIDEPAMVYVQVTPPAEEGTGGVADGNRNKREIALGAAVAPTKLMSVAARPADFDQFWQAKIKELKEIPEKPELTPGESGKANVEYATIKMDHVHGTHVYGQLAKPKREGKFPALVIFQWASPPYPLQKPWVTDRAAEGWLTLNIEPHDVLPDQPKGYYDALPREIKNYQSIGNNDREKSYFLDMYLRDYRAVDYMVGREDWDGKTLVVMGTSMGGQQSLCVAGLHPKITHLIVNDPAGCDTNGPLHGRQSGYPNFPSGDPTIMQTALYFDAVNFAPHIKATSLVAMGFVDTIAPPTGIWTAFNEIQGAKEAAPMIDSPHNNLATAAQQRPYTRRSAEWLNALVKGEDVKAEPAGDQSAAKKVVGVPRADKNSQLAHEQLLEKAKRGGIDVYFIGDSITRRWGTSDAQYKEMLANWNENFFGWNAADFGWGADTIENILWRLENGELDGVHPKVIVILAGTNNVGMRPADDAKVARIVQGIRAILDICREKAPDAKIVLTGIFPRNDNIAVVPTINQINEKIATFADGDRIRFLNVNDKLADSDGKLFAGMMGDRLHPTVKGYQVWADGLKPILTEWLGPPAKTDHAPPPTGDPSAAPKAGAEKKDPQGK